MLHMAQSKRGRHSSRHLLLLGGIGTGKSNAFNFLISNILYMKTQKDVVIIFDTKGDYYKEFYKPGDIVISNDDRATGPNGPDYWNVFNEVLIDDRVEENILEIVVGELDRIVGEARRRRRSRGCGAAGS